MRHSGSENGNQISFFGMLMAYVSRLSHSKSSEKSELPKKDI
jgi:hypothetical protein